MPFKTTRRKCHLLILIAPTIYRNCCRQFYLHLLIVRSRKNNLYCPLSCCCDSLGKKVRKKMRTACTSTIARSRFISASQVHLRVQTGIFNFRYGQTITHVKLISNEHDQSTVNCLEKYFGQNKFANSEYLDKQWSISCLRIFPVSQENFQRISTTLAHSLNSRREKDCVFFSFIINPAFTFATA